MGILATRWSYRTILRRAVLAQGIKFIGLVTLLLVALFTEGCSQQEPAFSESRDSQTPKSDDANVKGVGGAGGVEGVDPASLPPDVGAADAGGVGTETDSSVGTDGTGTAGTDAGVGTSDGGAGAGTGGGTADGGTGGTGGGTDGMAGGGGTGGGATGGGGTDGGVGLIERTVEVTQRGPGKVDILWVVDTSGSMSEEQQYLANNFNAMITALNNAGNDFQTAITTTDICQDTMPTDLAERVCPADAGGSAATHLRGAFRGDNGHKVLHQGDPDLVQKFNQYTSAGINGSGFEHGLKAAQMAVDKVLTGENEPLIRPDAFLAVIVVSDEEDDGIGLWKTDAYSGYNYHAMGLTDFKFTEDDMISYLRNVKGAGQFSISAITPTRLPNGNLCSAPHTQPLEEGTQYIAAANKSGGIIQSLCDTDWSQSLATIGLDLNAQLTQIVLPTTPDPSTIHMWVNNMPELNWSYNPGNNAVKFNGGHVPAEGAAIKVTYYEAH